MILNRGPPSGFETSNKISNSGGTDMYIEHPYFYEGKYYANIDGEMIEITKEVAYAMNNFYRSSKAKKVEIKNELGEVVDKMLREVPYSGQSIDGERILERMEQIFMIKENFIYVGIDLHKETHTAVMIDCYNQKLGEITFPNRPADFPKLVTKVKKCNTDGKEVVYGLENAYGYGRALAVWLIDKGYLVKDVNTAISHRQAKHRGAMYRKSDSDDVEAIALATLNMLDKLPNACPNDAY